MIEIRPAIAQDIPGLCEFETVVRHEGIAFDCTGVTMPGFVATAVAAGACYVAVIDGALAGLITLNYSFFGYGFVSLLITRERFRRKRVASELIRFVEGRCTTTRLFISTEQSNAPMQAVLATLGYQPSGVMENLGDNAEPELLYVKILAGQRT
jgi:GNAT superfamily N-acetyltransferase